MTYTIGSLFSGYGGLDMGVQAALGPARVAWVSDIEPGPTKILTHHHPDAPNLGDITRIDWTGVEPVDVICGGSPCQGFSSAGLRRGFADSRSGLWEDMRRAVEALRPHLVVWENVAAVATMPNGDGRTVLTKVLDDIEAVGYPTRAVKLAASEVGAPHKRARVFVVASDREGDRLLEQAEAPDLLIKSRRLLPTCTASMHAGPGNSWRRGGKNLQTFVRDGDWKDCGPSLTLWARLLGRDFPSPEEDGRLSPAFAEWMMGLPAGHVTSPEIGLSRTQQLRALGNGVVPRQAAAAIAVMTGQYRRGEWGCVV